MSTLLPLLVGALLGAGATAAALRWRPRLRRRAVLDRPGAQRVLLPFSAHEGIGEEAVAAALRLCASLDALLVPCALIVVPRRLAPDAPLPRAAERAVGALDAVELQAGLAGVAVDGRIERGRSLRHALAVALAAEPVGRVVVAAGHLGDLDRPGHPGFGPEDPHIGRGWTPADVAWLLGRVAPEVVVLRPALADAR